MLTRLPRRGSKKGPQEEQTRGASPSGSHARRRDVTTLAAHLPPCLRTHTRPPLRKHPSLSSFSSGFSRSSQLLLPPQGSRHGQAPGLHPSAVSFSRHYGPCHSALSFPLGRSASLSRTGTSRRAGQCLILDKDKMLWCQGPGFECLLVTSRGALVRSFCPLVPQCPHL